MRSCLYWEDGRGPGAAGRIADRRRADPGAVTMLARIESEKVRWTSLQTV